MPESTADYTVEKVSSIIIPSDLRVSQFGSELGFSTYTVVRALRGSAFSKTLEIVPSSFIGTPSKPYSHQVILEDADGKPSKNSIPAALNVKIRAVIARGKKEGCVASFRYSGVTY